MVENKSIKELENMTNTEIKREYKSIYEKTMNPVSDWYDDGSIDYLSILRFELDKRGSQQFPKSLTNISKSSNI